VLIDISVRTDPPLARQQLWHLLVDHQYAAPEGHYWRGSTFKYVARYDSRRSGKLSVSGDPDDIVDG
jgi:hypothetical protein